MSEEKKDQQQEAGKVRKKFETALQNLTQVIGGETLYKPTILIPAEIKAAVIELAKEEKEACVKDFKEKVITLIKKKREHDRTVAQLRKDFEKKEEEGMKSFTDEANNLFKILRDIQSIEKSYFDTLVSAGTGTSSVSETVTGSEEKEPD